jgi:siroheme synthase
VRLKSGDPLIFGRAIAEIKALQTAGCAYDLVPGLSSVLAAPLLAGIPLTDKQWSQGFAVFTAHQPATLNWSVLAQLETLVLLMGGRQLATICQALQAHGRSSATPIVVIRWAGQPEQQIWQGTLSTIGEQLAGQALSPCVIVIGAVVQLREALVRPQGRPTASEQGVGDE